MKINGNKNYLMPASIALSAIIAVYMWLGATETKTLKPNPKASSLPIELPVVWGNLGARMISAGVIDRDKLEAIYQNRGGLTDSNKRLLENSENGNLKISQENAGFLLNLFWAFGLSNKNEILEKGPMADPRYGDSSRFASTGGWKLAKGSTMSHYSKHLFVVLTPQQQALVEKVSKNIYRPCCDNSTYFPDCNHGMAMLGLLELMASQNASEEEMYKVALQVNSYWFPDTYLAIAEYFKLKGVSWEKADPKEILGYNFSSASGYRNILSQITPPAAQSGASCGL